MKGWEIKLQLPGNRKQGCSLLIQYLQNAVPKKRMPSGNFQGWLLPHNKQEKKWS
jgi:hypothetical protein